MPLSEDDRKYVNNVLDECEKALEDKPALASIFDEGWRQELRSRLLSANGIRDVGFPTAYDAYHMQRIVPGDYQYRLDEGARIVLPKLSKGDRNHLIQRLSAGNGLSAEEELLLARGCALQFGEDVIKAPQAQKGQSRPEFLLRLGSIEIDIEAKGLLDSQQVRGLNEATIQAGQTCWITCDPAINDPRRVREAVLEKLRRPCQGQAKVVVLTQYTPWPELSQAIPLLRSMAVEPIAFELEPEQYALTIAFVSWRCLNAVWFNDSVAQAVGVDDDTREQIREAIKKSFYPRDDGILFNETMDEAAHHKLLWRIRGWPPEDAAGGKESSSGVTT